MDPIYKDSAPQDDARANLFPPSLVSALAYSASGWAVLPLHSVKDGKCTCGKDDCSSPGKHPVTSHGLKDASKELKQIAVWFRTYSFANLGIATGSVSKLIVIDVDPRHGGNESVAALRPDVRLALESTARVQTGSGGWHAYFELPLGVTIPTRHGTVLGPGIDVKCDGGYVVGPPSMHVSGKAYTWMPADGEPSAPLAELPECLLRLLVEPAAKKPSGAKGKRIPEGDRNSSLFEIASAMFGKGKSTEEVRIELDKVNAARCEPPLPDTEVADIVASASKYAAKDQAQRPKLKFLTMEQIQNIPKRRWLVEGWVPYGGMVGLYGPSESGKSLVTLDLCLTMASDIDWRGQPIEHGPVVYLVGEGAFSLGDRTRAWIARHPTAATPNFVALDQVLPLQEASSAEAIIADLHLMAVHPMFIVVDTLNKYLPGGDENTSVDMGSFVGTIDRFVAEFGCTVLVQHHTPRSDKSVERGHGSFRNAAETMIVAKCENGVVTMVLNKQKDGPKNLPPLQWRIVPEGESVVVESIGGTSGGKKSKLNATQTAVLDAVGRGTDQGITRKDILTICSGLSPATVDRALGDLLELGMIQKCGVGRTLRYFEVVQTPF